MATYKIGNRTTTFSPGLEDSTYVLGKGKLIDSVLPGIYQASGLGGVSLEIAGTIRSMEYGIKFGETISYAPGLAVTVEKSGKIDSQSRAIDVHASDFRIDNDGKIFGTEGIRASGTDGVITNRGTIDAAAVGIVATGSNHIVNTGAISGGQYGIVLNATESGAGSIRNTGLVEGANAAIQGSSSADRIVNAGTMKGDVLLAGGDDVFVFKSGKVTGEIEGGMGADRYIVKAEGATIAENFGQGFDFVKASVSFTLAAHVEQINLVGKADIDATGNDQDNHVQGNAGRNVLRGEGGVDFLVGLGGNDRLFGGEGGDVFNFQAGSGRDTVMDFEAGIDEIQIGGLKGTIDFADMVANHVEEKGDDIWITYGKDVVILRNTGTGELQAGDFVFG
ncbi:MAG: hypothetical protein KL863_05475 [Rhizobium sp.]|nr:hypothetical protein [Rhizobium sp.]MBX9455509.1 hypothetical protein [Rhizobium sp.]